MTLKALNPLSKLSTIRKTIAIGTINNQTFSRIIEQPLLIKKQLNVINFRSFHQDLKQTAPVKTDEEMTPPNTVSWPQKMVDSAPPSIRPYLRLMR